MNRYSVVGDTVTYGGPKKFSIDNWHLSGATLMDCIDYVKSRISSEENPDIDLDTILSTKEDSMGTYTRYMIQRDNSIETVWLSLKQEERALLFKYALERLDELDSYNPLRDKIKDYER